MFWLSLADSHALKEVNVARISELEQRNEDTLEVAISQSEYDQLSSATDPLELRVTILSNTGDEIGSYMLSTDPADWVYDAETEEYLLVDPITGFGNHRTNWDGLVLSSTNDVGLDTVEDALMVGPYNEAVDADGPLATTVASATHIPVGTTLTLIDQSSATGSGGGATLRFDAPDVDTPIVTSDDDLGNTGTAPPICFANGTLIQCEAGPRRIEALTVGDRVMTQHNGLQTIRWIGQITFSGDQLRADPSKRPIRIAAGALGDGLPLRDLRLSRQHRVVVASSIVHRMTGQPEVLVAAHRLTALPRISLVCPKKGVTYYHILLDQHDVVFANGMPAESLYLGAEARKSLSRRSILEIEELGAIATQDVAALPMIDNRTQKNLVATHVASSRPVYVGAHAA